MITDSVKTSMGVPCTCCKVGPHVIAEVGPGRDFMTCKCSRKKCYLCFKCIIHCGCKNEIAALKIKSAYFDAFLVRVGGELQPNGGVELTAEGFGLWTSRKGTLMAKQILAEHGELIDIAQHFRHCRDCGEGGQCYEGDSYFERLEAISNKTEKVRKS